MMIEAGFVLICAAVAGFSLHLWLPELDLKLRIELELDREMRSEKQ